MSKFIPNSFQHPNAYVDEYMPLLTGNEYKVLTYAIRRIIGFQKTDDRISVSQFSEGIKSKDGKRLDSGTGLGEGAVRTALKELIKYRLIVVIAPADAKKNLPPLFTLQWNSDLVNKEGLELRMSNKKTSDLEKADKARVGLPPRSNPQPRSNGQTGPGLTVNTSPGLTDRGDNIPVEIQGNPLASNDAPPVEERKPDMLDGLLFYARSNAGKADLSFLAENLRPLGRAFVEIFDNLKPMKQDYSLWRKVLKEWYERGFTEAEVSRAARLHRDAELYTKSPSSITYALLNLKAESDGRKMTQTENGMYL